MRPTLAAVSLPLLASSLATSALVAPSQWTRPASPAPRVSTPGIPPATSGAAGLSPRSSCARCAAPASGAACTACRASSGCCAAPSVPPVATPTVRSRPSRDCRATRPGCAEDACVVRVAAHAHPTLGSTTTQCAASALSSGGAAFAVLRAVCQTAAMSRQPNVWRASALCTSTAAAMAGR